MKYIIALLTLFVSTSLFAQHSLQVDDGAGHFSFINAPTTSGTFTLPSSGGTLLTSNGGTSSPAWLVGGNTTPSSTLLGNNTALGNLDLRAGNATRLSLDGTTGAVTIPGAVFGVNGVSYTFPAANAAGTLTNNGSGTLSWTPASALSGGVNNTIPKWTSATTLGNSALTDNGTTLSYNSFFTVTTGQINTLGASFINTSTNGRIVGITNNDAPGGGAISRVLDINMPNGPVATGTGIGIKFSMTGGVGTSYDILGSSSNWKITNTGALTVASAQLSGLTASTVVATDASKNLTSVPNGTGVLTNNGSGTLSWVPASGGSSVSVEVSATNTAAQSIGVSGSGGPPTIADISFNSTAVSPTYGSFDGTKYTTTSAGTYLVTVSGANTAGNSVVGLQLLVNGTVVAYGAGYNSSNLSTDPQGRGNLSMVVILSSGDIVKVQGVCSNSGTGITFSTDGTTRLVITKLN